MPDAVITDIANAVTATLNAATLSMPFTAVRSIPYYDPSKTPGLKVFVLGMSQEIDVGTGTRGETPVTYTINVGIYNMISRDEDSEVVNQNEMDAMAYFVQQVCDVLLSNERLATYSDAALVKVTNAQTFDVASLQASDVFATVVSGSYWLLR